MGLLMLREETSLQASTMSPTSSCRSPLSLAVQLGNSLQAGAEGRFVWTCSQAGGRGQGCLRAKLPQLALPPHRGSCPATPTRAVHPPASMTTTF